MTHIYNLQGTEAPEEKPEKPKQLWTGKTPSTHLVIQKQCIEDLRIIIGRRMNGASGIVDRNQSGIRSHRLRTVRVYGSFFVC